MAERLGLNVVQACSILGVGMRPAELIESQTANRHLPLRSAFETPPPPADGPKRRPNCSRPARSSPPVSIPGPCPG